MDESWAPYLYSDIVPKVTFDQYRAMGGDRLQVEKYVHQFAHKQLTQTQESTAGI